MIEKARQKVSDWLLKNATFPSKYLESGNELDWMLKGNCPCCLAKPIEPLSTKEYQKKYPITHTISLGTMTISLCEQHFEELRKAVRNEY